MYVRETPLSEDSDYAVEVRAHAGQPEAVQEASRRGLRHHAQGYAAFIRESARHKQQRVTVAGAGVVAANTGRILLIQRSNKDESDPARGLWELPGGHLDEAESPWDAARREWSEETGIPFPTQGFLAGHWISNKIYAAHLFVIPAENDIDLHPDGEDRVGNPDDPGGDDIEAIAWWEPTHLLKANRSLRPEFIDGIDRPLLMKVCKEADSGDLVRESALAVQRHLR